jgi:uncharacterized delta-60 repeat protein
MKNLISYLCCFLLAGGLYAQSSLSAGNAGTIDHSFNPGDIGFGNGDGPNQIVHAVVRQADGKILIGGDFTTYNGIPRNRIARLHPNGALDHDFDPGTGFEGGLHSIHVYAIEVLTNGKILLGGYFDNFNGHAVNNLVQLNPDGSFDQGFDSGTGPNNAVDVIRQQPDGRILIGGLFTAWNDFNKLNLARLHPEGSIDDTFHGPDFVSAHGVREIQLHDDGRIMVGGSFAFADESGNHYLVRLFEDGSVDSAFNTDFLPVGLSWEYPFVGGIHITDQNKYLVTGRILIPDQFQPITIFQLNEDGGFDEDFQIPVMTSADFNSPSVYLLLPLAGDKYLIGGQFDSVNSLPFKRIAMIKSDGTLDTTFSSGEIEGLYRALRVEGGQLLIVPAYSTFPKIYLARINEDFNYDPTFNPGTGANERVVDVYIQNDEKIVISGFFTTYNGTSRNGIARILPDGSLDSSFDPGNGFKMIRTAYALAEQADGKILAGGNFTSFNDVPVNRLVRLNNNGSLDYSLNTGTGASHSVRDIKIQNDESIIVAGAFAQFNDQPAGRIVRLNPDGSSDENFNSGYGTNGTIRCANMQADGKILIAGDFTMFDSIARNRIARLNNNGSLDLDFDPGYGFQPYDIVANPRVYATGLQEDGKIIVAGLFQMFDSIPVNGIVRLNHNGSLDTSFTYAYELMRVHTMLIQPDDRIVIGGMIFMIDSVPAGHFARLNADGSIDTTFQTGIGFNNFVETLALQEDGNILAGGWFTAYDGTGRNRIARISGDGPEGVRNDFKTALIKVYPNPAHGYIHIETDRCLQGAMIRLYDLQGRMLQEQSNISGRSFRIDLAGHKPGVYMVEVISGELIGRQKVIRQ